MQDRVTQLGALTQGWRSALAYDALVRRAPGGVWQTRLRARLAGSRGLWRWSGSPLLDSPDARRPYRRLDRARGAQAPQVSIERRPRIEAMTALLESLGHDGRLRHVRDPEYLAWRFPNPMHEYRFLFAGGERLDGYLVLRARVMGAVRSPRVCIVDLEGRDARVRAGLLRAAVEAGRFGKLLAWGATPAQPPDPRGIFYHDSRK